VTIFFRYILVDLPATLSKFALAVRVRFRVSSAVKQVCCYAVDRLVSS